MRKCEVPSISIPPFDILGSSNPTPYSDFTFIEDQYNILHDNIDSLTSAIEGLQTTAHGLQNSVDGLTALLHHVLVSQDALNASFDSISSGLLDLNFIFLAFCILSSMYFGTMIMHLYFITHGLTCTSDINVMIMEKNFGEYILAH